MESQQEEWKESFREEALNTINGFANSHGGTLIVGKRDDGEIIGVRNAKKLLEEIPNTVNNLMHFYPDVEERIMENGKTCVIVTVKSQKRAVDVRGVYYRRSGSNTVKVTGDELALLILHKTGSSWTNLITDKVKLSDLSKDAVSIFIKRGQEAKRISSAADPNDIEGALRRYKLMTDEGITNAAAVLFANEPKFVSRAAVTKIGLFEKKGGRLLMEDIIDGPIVFQPEEVMDRLTEKYVQPRFDIEGVYRVVKYRYPLKALREAVNNAIIHREYLSSEHTTIRVYPDSVEIYNPGSLPEGWTAEKLLTINKSKPANPLIAEIFHDMDLIEAWGVGVSLIQDECEKARIPKPVYEVDDSGIKIIFRSEPWSEGKESEPVTVIFDDLTPFEIEVYKAIEEGKYTTSKDVALLLGSSERGVRRATDKLKAIGRIRREGNNRSGKWETAPGLKTTEVNFKE